MQERRNYYRILQAQPDAPAEVIRGNYRTLLQKLRIHPDLGGSDRDAASVNLAYQTLRDPVRRAAYDRELLARYSVRVLGQGGSDAVHLRSSGGKRRDNRRNHYRVLQVQRDASPAIIDASFRALRAGADEVTLTLLKAAYAVLSDPARRRAYDAEMSAADWESSADELARVPAVPGAEVPQASPFAEYEPLIVRYCAFCKTPHGQYVAAEGEATCIECGSALDVPRPANAPDSGRDAIRLPWESEVRLRLEWPGPVVDAVMRDFSPQGALIETTAQVGVGEIVRLESEQVSAVARVVHCQAGEGEMRTRAGLQFITTRFMRSRGTFVSAQA